VDRLIDFLPAKEEIMLYYDAELEK
jgi:hypothetical protein